MSNSPTTFRNEDVNLTRLTCIYKKVVTKVLHFVFAKGSSTRRFGETLLDYYERHGINKNIFKRKLFEAQRRKLDADPGGSTFDITLLSTCLRNGYHGLAGPDDEKWVRDDGNSIESLITMIKNKRNQIAHENVSYTNQQLIEEANELKTLLVSVLEFSGQLYNLSASVINLVAIDAETNILSCLYDDFEPKTYEEYKNQLFFEAQSEYVNCKGLEDVLEQYDKSFENQVTVTSHAAKVSIPLEDIYTNMEMKEKTDSNEQSMSYDEILMPGTQNSTDSIVVVSGPSGAGKTTLMKKMIKDWRTNQNTMKYLLTHDHLFKVDCRKTIIRSFESMLQYFMPKISKDFKTGDLQKVILHQKVMVILDGLDEINESSANLFDELLQIKKSFGITLVITTRPEKLEYIRNKVQSHHIKMRHIELLGIDTEKRHEFIKKYIFEISEPTLTTRHVNVFLKCLEGEGQELDHFWRLPFNLALLSVFWSINYTEARKLSINARLYTEIFRMHREKLKERLCSCEATGQVNNGELDKRVNKFLYALGRESLIALKYDYIDLPNKAFEGLEKVCEINKLPTQEMLGAFLHYIPGSCRTYSFPHKHLRDSLAAFYIWMVIKRKDQNFNINEVLENVVGNLDLKNIHEDVADDICCYARWRLQKSNTEKGLLQSIAAGTIGQIDPKYKASSTIHIIFQQLHSSSTYDVARYHNVLICLIHMFSTEKEEVEECNKLEALGLLQRAGTDSKDAWVAFLESAQCDPFVASYISNQPSILVGDIRITDSSVSAYSSLMKALKIPQKETRKVSVNIDIKRDLSTVYDLLSLISEHKLNLNSISIYDENVKQYTQILKDLKFKTAEGCKVKTNIAVNANLLEIKDLLKEIKTNGFLITKLALKKKDITVNDSNLVHYTEVFNNMPVLAKGAFRGKVSVILRGERSNPDQLWREISKNELTLRISLTDSFQRLRLQPVKHRDSLSKLFQSCHVTSYMGPVPPIGPVPETMKSLSVAVGHLESFAQLRKLSFDKASTMKHLYINLDVSAIDRISSPLLSGGYQGWLSLLLPDINREKRRWACDVARTLMPTAGKMEYKDLYFPRCKDDPMHLIQQLIASGVKVRFSVVLPASLMPESSRRRDEMERLVRDEIGADYGIFWGNNPHEKDETISNVNTW